jgi:HD-GYP domain-containing protein (c-di-GMP phosphodiesterase class II)
MKTVKKVLLAVALLVATAWGLAAQDAITKAVDSANTHLLVREYDKAYSYASFIIRYYAGKEMPIDAVDVCERVVSAYSSSLKDKGNLDELIKMDATLSSAPASVQAKAADNIAYAKKTIEQQKAAIAKAEEEKKAADAKAEADKKAAEAEQQRLADIDAAIKLEKQKEADKEALRQKEQREYEQKAAELKAERDKLAEQQKAEIDAILEKNSQAEQQKEAVRAQERIASQNLQAELDKQRLESEKSLQEQLTKIVEMNNQSGDAALRTVSNTSTAVVIGLAILGLIVLAGISLIVIMSMRQQAIQHEQFQSTIKAMTGMRNAQPDLSAIALPFINQNMQMQALATPNVQMLENKTGGGPTPSSTPGAVNTPDELKALYDKCLVYADQIDQVTNRKNASKRVAELVYKIAKANGYAEPDALLLYTVGLIYDIGFLNIDPVILRSDHISEDQFETIKSHTTIGTNMVFFIDEKNRQLFKDGVSKHHENLDGTGYPAGLKAPDIPFIARALRVAETYIALVSARDYKSITDRESAMKELYDHSEQYDVEIVKILDGIV